MNMPLRFAAIGLGQRTAAVLRAVRQIGARFELVGYVDPAPVGMSLLGENGIAVGTRYDNERALLSHGRYDLLIIGSPNHLHATQLALALDGASPVFVEKPIVRTEAESFALAQRLRRPAPPLFVGLVMRSAPIVREIFQVVREGHLGQIVSIDATEHLPPEHGAYLARNWRRKREWGGSFLLDKVCHDFDILDAIAGARPQRVASFGGRGQFRPERAGGRDDTPAYRAWPGGWAAQDDVFSNDHDVSDTQTAIVEYANGVRLSFHASSHSALRERRWYINGTEGTLIADLDRNKLMWRRALEAGAPVRQTYPVDGLDHNGADVAMAQDLVDALAGKRKFPVTAREALEAGLTVMAIDKAMVTGQVVDCTPMWDQFDAANAT